MEDEGEVKNLSNPLTPIPTKEREGKFNFLISATPTPWKKDRDKKEQKDQKSLKKY